MSVENLQPAYLRFAVARLTGYFRDCGIEMKTEPTQFDKDQSIFFNRSTPLVGTHFSLGRRVLIGQRWLLHLVLWHQNHYPYGSPPVCRFYLVRRRLILLEQHLILTSL